MQRQRELLQPRAHDLQEASGLGLVLESDDEIVGIAHDDHVARGLTPSPALSPEIEDVVQVDVGKKRRCHRPLPGPLVTNRHDSVFKDARPEPFLDQADDAWIADPVLHEADQPVLILIPTTSASSASCGPRPARKPYENPRKSSS